MQLAPMIDHTLLKAEAMPHDIQKLCEEALEYGFCAVCVNPIYVPLAVQALAGSKVLIATVVGFPLGASTTALKCQEARWALEAGAHEIDMVMPVGPFRGGDVQALRDDIAAVVDVAGAHTVKVILETCFLTPEQIVQACEIAVACGASFVKTSTGFGTRGATVEDVQIMKRTVGDRCSIKASGGIRSLAEALAMVEAGATRIGTSSGIRIVQEEEAQARG